LFAQISQTFFISLFQHHLKVQNCQKVLQFLSWLFSFFKDFPSPSKKKEMQASSIISQTGTMGLAHGLSILPLLNTPPIPTDHLLQAIHSGAGLPTITSLAYEIRITDSNSTWVLSLCTSTSSGGV
jgi:hypothetical protein